jgi:hypothetical protein
MIRRGWTTFFSSSLRTAFWMDSHVKMDAEISIDSLADIGALSKLAEQYGFDWLWVNETKHGFRP